MTQYKHTLFMLVDGARPDVMQELVQAGDMPNLSRHMIERGGFAQASSVFPSTTGPAHVPFTTGAFPGRVNLPGIRWLDPEAYGRGLSAGRDRYRSYVGPGHSRMDSDTQFAGQTLFEVFPHNVNVLGYFGRGVAPNGHPGRLHIPMLLWARFAKNWEIVDRYCGKLLCKVLRDRPSYIFACFPAVDENAHNFQPESERVKQTYRAFDNILGDVVAELKAAGTYDETLLMLSADHGLSATDYHFDLDGFIRARNPGHLTYPTIWTGFVNAPAAVMISGNSMAHVYFRCPKQGWGKPVFFDRLEEGGHKSDNWANGDIVDALLDRREIDIVAGRLAGGRVVVRSKRGRAEIRRDGDRLHYHVSAAGDPFGYEKMPSCMSWQQALELTIHSDYPDGILQVAQIFESSRCGDLTVTSAPGFDLRSRYEIPEHRGSHGSLHREHMQVPLVSSHPLPSLRAGACRTVDVYPTVLELMGESVPEYQVDIDGRSLLHDVAAAHEAHTA